MGNMIEYLKELPHLPVMSRNYNAGPVGRGIYENNNEDKVATVDV